MSEDQLLSETVRKFSERFPEKRGQLFHVSNERNNQIQVYQARAKGIFPGVSDLIYFEFEISDYPWYTKILGIELKVPGNRHKREHIEIQIEWAEILEREGGVWRLCTNSEDAISCTQMNFKGLTIADVKLMLKTQKTKTIKF